jgi:riboflavin synthase
MKIKAVIERFEGDQAVIALGENGDECIVPRASLPRGAVAGLWLLVELAGDHVINAVIDEEETKIVRERLSRLGRGWSNARNKKD